MATSNTTPFMQAGDRPYRPVLLFLLSGMSLFVALAGRIQQHASYTPVTLAWLLTMLAFMAACLAIDKRRDDVPPLALNWTTVDTLLIVSAVAIALPLRVAAIGSAPPTMLGDEGAMAMEAVRVLAHQHTDPFATGWGQHPMLWFFLQSYAIRIFGDSVAGVRILSAIVGSATVATTYFLARLLYGRRQAGIAALLLATYHFHIHFSRLAIFNIADPLFGTVVVASLFIGIRTRRAAAFGVMGLMLGLALYFYPGTRLFILLVALSTLIWAIPWARQQGSRMIRKLWLPVLLTCLGVLIAAGPLLQTYAGDPQAFTVRERANTITEPGWIQDQARSTRRTPVAIMLDQVAGAALAFTSYPNADGFYDNQRPLLWGLAAPLMVIGLLLALGRSGDRSYMLPILWFVLAIIFGGVVLKYPPASAHFVTLAPVVCLFIAFAIEWILRMVERRTDGRPHIPRIIATLLVAYLATVSVLGYFRDYLPREALGGPNTHAANALARYLERQPAGTKVWFLGMPRMYYHGFPMLDFLARQVDAADALTLWVMPAPERGRTTIYAVLPEHRPELEATEARYPGGERQTLTWPTEPGPMVYIYRVMPPTVTRCAGIGQGADSRCQPDTLP